MIRPAKEWFSAQELAGLALPGMPASKKGVLNLAKCLAWADALHAGQPAARKREGRGGGLEFHAALLPESARARLRNGGGAMQTVRPGREVVWARWEQISPANRAEALRRLAAVERIETMIHAGMRKAAAVDAVVAEADREARSAGGQPPFSARTVYDWLKRIDGVRTDDRAAYLAADYVGRTKSAEIHPDAWKAYLTAWLRQEQPPHAECYRLVKRMAKQNGWDLPHPRTFVRRLAAEVGRDTEVLMRKGPQAARHTFAHADRDRSNLRALQVANLDAHIWDVFCLYEDGKVERPIMVAVQDVHSSLPLGVCFDRTVNHHAVRLALADTFQQFGLIDGLIMDNGRENSARNIAGGIPRWRGRAVEEEPDGLLKLLGIEATFATPYWGQAKPIERMFRDLSKTIAKHPAFAGAYVGHKVDAKPENYQSKAIPIAEFERIVRSELTAYREQTGRRGRGMNGRSFQEVYDASIAMAPPRRATPEQLRLCLLSSKVVMPDRKSGAVKVEDHRYWSPELSALRRQRMVLRFDPLDLRQRVYVYDVNGKYLCEAARTIAGNYNDQRTAQYVTAERRKQMKKLRAAASALDLLEIGDLAAQLPQPDGTPTALPPATNVVSVAFGVPQRPEHIGRTKADQSRFDDAFEQAAASLGGAG